LREKMRITFLTRTRAPVSIHACNHSFLDLHPVCDTCPPECMSIAIVMTLVPCLSLTVSLSLTLPYQRTEGEGERSIPSRISPLRSFQEKKTTGEITESNAYVDDDERNHVRICIHGAHVVRGNALFSSSKLHLHHHHHLTRFCSFT